MRNFKSSLKNLIGIALVYSLVWHICDAYPNGRDYSKPSHLRRRRDVSQANNERDATPAHLLHELHYPLVEKTAPQTWHLTKRQVSTSENKLKPVDTREIGRTFSIDNSSNEDDRILSDNDFTYFDDLPETLVHAIEKDTSSEFQSNKTNNNTESNASYYNSDYWNGMRKELIEAIQSFFGSPTVNVLQVDRNATKPKRELSKSIGGTRGSKSAVSQILQQFMPATATQSQQDEMCKCVDDATTEIQNLLNQIKAACINIKDGLSVGPPLKENSTCNNPGFVESAPLLIQNLIENPEQIAHIPEILQSSVPASQMSESVDKLKDSFKKIFGLLKNINTEAEDPNCQEGGYETSESIDKIKKLDKINNLLDSWKAKLSCKHGNANIQSCDKCSLKQVTNPASLTSTLYPALGQALPPSVASPCIPSDLLSASPPFSTSILDPKFIPALNVPATSAQSQITNQQSIAALTPASNQLINLPALPVSPFALDQPPSLNVPLVPSSQPSLLVTSGPSLSASLNLPSTRTLVSDTTSPYTDIIHSDISQSSTSNAMSTPTSLLADPSINPPSSYTTSSTYVPFSNAANNLGSNIPPSNSADLNNGYTNYPSASDVSSNNPYLQNNYPNPSSNTGTSSSPTVLYNNHAYYPDASDPSGYKIISNYPTYSEYSGVTGITPVPANINAGLSPNPSIPYSMYNTASSSSIPLSQPSVYSDPTLSTDITHLPQSGLNYHQAMESQVTSSGNVKLTKSQTLPHKLSKHESLKEKIGWLLSLIDSKSMLNKPQLKIQSKSEPCLTPAITPPPVQVPIIPEPVVPSTPDTCVDIPKPISVPKTDTCIPYISDIPTPIPEVPIPQKPVQCSVPVPQIIPPVPEPYLPPQSVACNQTSGEENKKFIESEAAKKLSKFNKFLNFRRAKRAVGPKCIACQESSALNYNDERNRARLQVLQISVPPTSSHVCQPKSTIPNPLVAPRLSAKAALNQLLRNGNAINALGSSTQRNPVDPNLYQPYPASASDTSRQLLYSNLPEQNIYSASSSAIGDSLKTWQSAYLNIQYSNKPTSHAQNPSSNANWQNAYSTNIPSQYNTQSPSSSWPAGYPQIYTPGTENYAHLQNQNQSPTPNVYQNSPPQNNYLPTANANVNFASGTNNPSLQLQNPNLNMPFQDLNPKESTKPPYINIKDYGQELNEPSQKNSSPNLLLNANIQNTEQRGYSDAPPQGQDPALQNTLTDLPWYKGNQQNSLQNTISNSLSINPTSPGSSLQIPGSTISSNVGSLQNSLPTTDGSINVPAQNQSPHLASSLGAPNIDSQTSSLSSSQLPYPNLPSVGAPSIQGNSNNPAIGITPKSPSESINSNINSKDIVSGIPQTSLDPHLSISNENQYSPLSTGNPNPSLQAGAPNVSPQPGLPNDSLQPGATNSFPQPGASSNASPQPGVSSNASLQPEASNVSPQLQATNAYSQPGAPNVSPQSGAPNPSSSLGTPNASSDTTSPYYQSRTPDASTQSGTTSPYYQSGTTNPYSQPGSTNPYSPLDNTNQYSLPGTSNSQPGSTNTYSQPGMGNAYSQPGVNTSPQPGAPNASLQPGAPNASLQPGAPNASLQPGAPNAALQPGAPNAALQPGTPNAALQPGTPNAALQPGVPNTSLQLGVPNASFQPGALNAALQPGALNAALQSGAPNAALQPGAPNTALQPGAPNAALQPGVPNTSLQLGVPNASSQPEASSVYQQPGATNSLQTSTSTTLTGNVNVNNLLPQSSIPSQYDISKSLGVNGNSLDPSRILSQGGNLQGSSPNGILNPLSGSMNLQTPSGILSSYHPLRSGHLVSDPSNANPSISLKNSNNALTIGTPTISLKGQNLDPSIDSPQTENPNTSLQVKSSTSINQILFPNINVGSGYSSNSDISSSGINIPQIGINNNAIVNNQEISGDNKNVYNIPGLNNGYNADLSKGYPSTSSNNYPNTLTQLGLNNISPNGNLGIHLNDPNIMDSPSTGNADSSLQSKQLFSVSPIELKNNFEIGSTGTGENGNTKAIFPDGRSSNLPFQNINSNINLNLPIPSGNLNIVSQNKILNIPTGATGQNNSPPLNIDNIVSSQNDYSNILGQSKNVDTTNRVGNDNDNTQQNKYISSLISNLNPLQSTNSALKIKTPEISLQGGVPNIPTIDGKYQSTSEITAPNAYLGGTIPKISAQTTHPNSVPGSIDATGQTGNPYSIPKSQVGQLSDVNLDLGTTAHQQPYSSIDPKLPNLATSSAINQQAGLPGLQSQLPTNNLGQSGSAVGNALNAVSSLIAPNSLNNKSPLEAIGLTASAVAEAITGASSLISSDPKNNNDLPLESLRASISSLAEAISDASTLVSSESLNKELPLEQLGNTAATVIDMLSGASSLLAAQSAQTPSSRENNNNQMNIINNAVSTFTDVAKKANSLTNSQGQLHQRAPWNPNIKNSLKLKQSMGPGAAAPYTPGALASVAGTFPGIGGSSPQGTANGQETVATNIAKSVASMANSASIVANSLSSAINQLSSQNQEATGPLPPITTDPLASTSHWHPSNYGSDSYLPALQNQISYPGQSQTTINNHQDTRISLVLPRDKISSALNGGVIVPGDMITIALNNQATLVGKVMDSASPISFNVVKRNNRESLPMSLPQGKNNWSISSSECKDTELKNILQQISTNIIVT